MTKKEIIKKIDVLIEQISKGKTRGQERTLIEDLEDIAYEIENELEIQLLTLLLIIIKGNDEKPKGLLIKTKNL